MEQKTKILYVDDEYINLELFHINLEDKYEIFTAENGFEGLKILNEHPNITYVISDMKMPKMDGIEFIQKANDSHPEIKYFILTGFGITSTINDALETGLIIGYLSKPIKIEEIEDIIEENRAE